MRTIVNRIECDFWWQCFKRINLITFNPFISHLVLFCWIFFPFILHHIFLVSRLMGMLDGLLIGITHTHTHIHCNSNVFLSRSLSIHWNRRLDYATHKQNKIKTIAKLFCFKRLLRLKITQQQQQQKKNDSMQRIKFFANKRSRKRTDAAWELNRTYSYS